MPGIYPNYQETKMQRSLALAVVFPALFAVSAFAAIKPEHDPLKPRVPPDQIAAAKALKPPFPMTPEAVKEGEKLFNGVATCFMCHGNDGKGQGVGAESLTKVGPRNFTNAAFHKAKTCGEMFWVASNGTKGDFSVAGKPSHPEGTGMVKYLKGGKSKLGLPETPTVTETELWKIVFFERSLGGGTC